MIDFLVTHKWVRPKPRHSRIRNENRNTEEWRWRWYCIKCGASKRKEPEGGFGAYPRTLYRAWGDIERKVANLPPCVGHPVAIEGA